MTEKLTVLITGAAGNIGKKLRSYLGSRYTLKLLDIPTEGDPDLINIDLSHWDERLVELFEGVDVLVHLAADPHEHKTWEQLIPSNLDALSNVFIAAVKAKVPRVVYASSNHVMGGYAEETKSGRWLGTAIEHRPGTHYQSADGVQCDSTPYGAMKLFGERLGKCYAQATGAVCIAIRLGWVNRIGENRPEDLPEEASDWFKLMWLSTDDMCQLLELAIVAPMEASTFLVVNGMSNNEGMVWDLEGTKSHLGFQPKDSLTLR
jgi:NAD+ dependent glucose-6-phosphate dehydrogenase